MSKTNFKLEIPLTKSYTNDEGYYHIAFSISTTSKDFYGDIITDDALKNMLNQAKDISINANHEHDLKNIIGPVVDAWIEKKDEISYLWVEVRVRKEWETIIKDLIDSGISLGGSIEGEITSSTHISDEGILINDIHLYGAALTTIPANGATLGTATTVEDGCPGSMCMQLEKFLKKENMEDGTLLETEETGKGEENMNENKNALNKMMEKMEQIYSKLNPEEEEYFEKEAKAKIKIENLNKTLQKAEEKNLKLGQEVLKLKTENTKLNNSIIKKKQDVLIKEALNLNKKLDPNTKIINKEMLIKEVKSYSNVDEKDIHLQLEIYNKGLELALKKIPNGDLPQVNLIKTENKIRSNLKEEIKAINEMKLGD